MNHSIDQGSKSPKFDCAHCVPAQIAGLDRQRRVSLIEKK
jgi:hypothetical protein